MLAAAAFAIDDFVNDRRGFTVSIDLDEVSYAELWLSRSSKTLTMGENREELTALISALNGKYGFYDKMDVPRTDGGYIAYSILFLDSDGREICRYSIGYDADLIYIYHEKRLLEKAAYYRFMNEEHDLDFPFHEYF